MKKLFSALASIIILFSASVSVAQALPAGNFGFDKTAEKSNYTTNGKGDTIEEVIQKVVTGFLSLIAIFFFGLMIYAGIRWMTAHGEAELVEKSKNIIRAAIIGLVIIMSAYALTSFVLRVAG